MTQEAEQLIIEAAMTMRPEHRARLADQLLASLDGPDAPLSPEWIAEIERRIRAYETGELAAVPADASYFQSIRAKLTRGSAQADAGQFVDPDDVLRQIDDLKRDRAAAAERR